MRSMLNKDVVVAVTLFHLRVEESIRKKPNNKLLMQVNQMTKTNQIKCYE